MPFLFEKIADYIELLLPDDLLSNTSIPNTIRNYLTKENCQNIEIRKVQRLSTWELEDKK